MYKSKIKGETKALDIAADSEYSINRGFTLILRKLRKIELEFIKNNNLKVTQVEFSCITFIELLHDKPMSYIADYLLISRGPFTTMINSLTKKGIIKKYQNRINKKKIYLKLTLKGERYLEFHNNFRKKIYEKFSSFLSKNEVECFTKIGAKILINL